MPGGRPVGSLGKRTLLRRKIAADASRMGVSPLDVMLENMYFYYLEAGKLLDKIRSQMEKPDKETLRLFAKLYNTRELAEHCASDAAPFCHPRLTTVEVSGEVDYNTKPQMSPAEALVVLAQHGFPLPPRLLEHKNDEQTGNLDS